MLLCDPVRSVACFYSANRKACFTKLHIVIFLRIMKASPGCYVSMQAKALMFSFQPLNHGTQLPRSFS